MVPASRRIRRRSPASRSRSPASSAESGSSRRSSRGLDGERPGERDPLPLAAGQRAGQAVAGSRPRPTSSSRLGHLGLARCGGRHAAQPHRRRRRCAATREVGEELPVLEHQREAALVGRRTRRRSAPVPDGSSPSRAAPARRRRRSSVDFPRPRRPEQRPAPRRRRPGSEVRDGRSVETELRPCPASVRRTPTHARRHARRVPVMPATGDFPTLATSRRRLLFRRDAETLDEEHHDGGGGGEDDRRRRAPCRSCREPGRGRAAGRCTTGRVGALVADEEGGARRTPPATTAKAKPAGGQHRTCQTTGEVDGHAGCAAGPAPERRRRACRCRSSMPARAPARRVRTTSGSATSAWAIGTRQRARRGGRAAARLEGQMRKPEAEGHGADARAAA